MLCITNKERYGHLIQQRSSHTSIFLNALPPTTKTSFTARCVAHRVYSPYIYIYIYIYIIIVIVLHSLISLPCIILCISHTTTVQESLDDIMNTLHL